VGRGLEWLCKCVSNRLVRPSAYEIGVAAGTFPATIALGTVSLSTTPLDLGWKVTRTSDTRWTELNDPSCSMIGCQTLPSGAVVWGEQIVPYANGNALPAYTNSPVYNTAPYWTNPATGDAWLLWMTNTTCYDWMSENFPNYEFFDGTFTKMPSWGGPLSSSCQQLLNVDMQKGGVIWNYFVARGWHPYIIQTSSNCGSASGSSCWGLYKSAAEIDQALIHEPSVAFANQHVERTTTISTPSQSVALSAARTAIGGQGCATAEQYDAALDPTNWGPPSCDQGDAIGTANSDQTPETGDDSVVSPAAPVPMSPAGPVDSGYSTDLWPPDATATTDGLEVVSSTDVGTTAVSGVVEDDSTGLPVAGAIVTMTCTSSCSTNPVTATTDDERSFAFIDLVAGEFDIAVDGAGYGSYALTDGSYAADETYELTASLTADRQTYDVSDTPGVTGSGDALADTYPLVPAFSPTRVPPSISVQLLPLNRDCAAAVLTDPLRPTRRSSTSFTLPGTRSASSTTTRKVGSHSSPIF
jgi:hypothetical protein